VFAEKSLFDNVQFCVAKNIVAGLFNAMIFCHTAVQMYFKYLNAQKFPLKEIFHSFVIFDKVGVNLPVSLRSI
jgi:hypothetical protein